jgi:Flp pilus assembly protein TadG
MRWLDEDEGGVAIIVAITLVVLFGMGALVLDVGNLYWERRQLQVGAEAGALAAAQDFASGEGAAAAEASARTFTSENNTRDAYVEDIYQPTANSVTVETITGSSDSAGVLDAFLAGVIGTDDYFARASATAAWGGFGGGATVPLTFSKCEWDHLTGGNVANLPTGERTVYFHSSQTAKSINTCGGPANQDHPGGFGWLNTNGPGCSAIVDMGLVDTDTGNNVPNDCSEAYFQGLIGGEPVILPIFDDILNPQGNNATFRIVGFAALEVTGYRFSGSKFNEPAGNVPCSGNDRCIRGRFVAYYDLGSEPAAGAPDFGAYTISLTG